MFIKANRLILCLLLMLQISACGFHLRGNSQIADRFNPLYVVNENLDPALLKLIRAELIRSSAIITEVAESSNRLQVAIKPLKNRKIASSNLTNVELVQLTMNLQFSVQSGSGEYLLSQLELVQSVEVQLDNANVLANEQTILTAQKGLQRKLIQSMISRLSR